ncbi:MAG: hypothetical protein BXU00_01870 [Candidatus Nanoclepta minutus]|uniref:Uncharacterized protein n=1 Tax=Candidatus Nanoclepta minutus TaxID=1940235 RepID=A0A397WP26_9ARCH|nr:MAG: hypothetical protein BXU00_01870 [Candidatus Nanoclepta minutus]
MIDITKIPRLVIWVGISIFVIFLIYLGYNFLQYNVMKPYERYFVADCYYNDNSSLIIITAKRDISNVNITDLDYSSYCFIKQLSKDSMDACRISNREEGGKVLVKVTFSSDNFTYSAIVPCRVEEKKGLLSWLLGK